MDRRSLLAMMAASPWLATGPARAQQGEVTTVKFGYQPTAPIASFLAANGINAFGEQKLKLDITNASESAVHMQLLSSGQIHLAGAGIPSFLQLMSLGGRLKIVSCFEYTFTDSTGYPWEAAFLAAPKDRGIKSLADLKGKKVATPGYSVAWYLALRPLLAAAGVNLKDVTFLIIPFPQMRGAMMTREIDAGIMTSTELVRLKQQTEVETIMTGTQMTGVKMDMTQVIIGRDDWLQQNEATVVRFIKALLKARQYMQADIDKNKGANVKRFISEQLKFDEFLTETYYSFRAGYIGRELEHVNSLDVPRSTVERYRKILTDGGLLQDKGNLAFENLVDRRYLKKAHQELGMTWDESKVEA